MFDGRTADYKYWKERTKDHVGDTWMGWRALLDAAEQYEQPITKSDLDGMRFDAGVTGWDLAVDLWNFISKKIGQNLYERRNRLVAGDRFNGFELWQRLFHEHEGCDLLVQMAGRRRLQEFPVCTAVNLASDLEKWNDLVQKYGTDIPDSQLQVMLIRILPSDLQKDVMRKPELMKGTTKAILDWIDMQITWSKNEALAGQLFRSERIFAVRPERKKRKPHQAFVPQAEQEPQGTITAVGTTSRAPRAPIPAEWGSKCYHCGKPGHSRTAKPGSGKEGCRQFTALLKANNGKLPPDYVGELEKFMISKGLMAERRASVNSIVQREIDNHDESDTESDDDDDGESSRAESHTSNMIWEAPRHTCKPRELPLQRTDIELANRGDGVAPDAPHFEGDEIELIHAVWTPPTTPEQPRTTATASTTATAPPSPTSPKPRKRRGPKSIYLIQEFNHEYADDIAILEDYVCSNRKALTVPPPPKTKAGLVWAMIDSGSGPMVADCPVFFPKHTVVSSRGQRQGTEYVSASGGKIKHEGQIHLTHQEKNGDKFNLTMQNAKVSCPILSVKYFTEQNCRVLFRKGGGVIIHADGRRMAFTERLGVFFIALNVLDPDLRPTEDAFGRKIETPDFIRPGGKA